MKRKSKRDKNVLGCAILETNELCSTYTGFKNEERNRN